VRELWELDARERVRDTIAAYHEAGDRYRLDELADCFTEDGVLEIRGRERVVGRAAIRDLLSRPRPGSRPRPDGFYVRHHVSSVRIESVTPDEAHTSAYFFVVTPAGPDHWGRYRDTLVPVGERWLFRHRFVATDGYGAGSYFATPPGPAES
jgi:SnoaL-like domain